MPGYRLTQGLYLELRGREYVIEKRLPSGELQLKDVVSEAFIAVTDADLQDAYLKGALRFLGDARCTAARRQAVRDFVSDIHVIPEDDSRKQTMNRRFAYVHALLERNLVEPKPSDIKRAVAEIHAEFKEEGAAPNWKTVYYGWVKTFVDSGQDIRSLVPAYKKRGNKTRKFCGQPKFKGSHYTEDELAIAEEMTAIIDSVVKARYLTLERLTVDAVYDSLLVRISEENLTRKGREFPVPSRSAIYRIVNQLDQYEVVKGRYGKATADKMFQVYVKGVVLSRPLERVEMDSTRLDIMVIDEEEMLPMGRPTFTVAIDGYTKMILGFFVSFDGEGALALLECLKHAVLPKTYVKTEYPEVNNTWEAHGLPELIVFDNGPGQHSKHLEDACKQLGIATQFCPVRQPWFKGSVERYLQTQNTLLLHGIPGTTFSNIFERADYDPEKHAIVGFKTLLKVLHKFVIDVYQHRPHRGLRDVPARLWRESIKAEPQRWAPHPDELRILLGHIEERRLHSSGIDFLGFKYSNSALGRLFRRRKPGTKSMCVTIKYDPSDLNAIYVYDPEEDEFIMATSDCPKYTRGLRLYQHQIHQRYLRKKKLNARNPDEINPSDPIQLAKARNEIREIIENDWQALRKKGPRSRKARYQGTAQPDHQKLRDQEATKAARVLSQGRKKSEMPRLGPASGHVTGASDIGDAVNETVISRTPIPVPQLSLETPDSRKRRQIKGRTERAKNKTETPAASPRPSLPALPPAQTDDDDVLDMTGWSSAKMPRKER